MARPRTPTTILEAKGAFVKDPQRARDRANEPEPTGPLGTPPATFTREQRDVWAELIANVPANVLTNADRHLVEMYCRVMAKLRAATTPRSEENPQGFGPYGAPDLKVGELNFLMSCMSRMGMTPADRSKVKLPASDADANPFEDFAQHLKQ